MEKVFQDALATRDLLFFLSSALDPSSIAGVASFPTDFPDHLIFAIRPLTRLSIFTSNQNDLGPEHYCHPITCLSLYFIRYQTFLPKILRLVAPFNCTWWSFIQPKSTDIVIVFTTPC